MSKSLEQGSDIGQGLEILARLRKHLIKDSSACLAKESADLYYHIEKTLLSELREHYEKQRQARAQN